MRIPKIGFTLALAVVAASMAHAAPPAAPQVTMGADIKLLRFDWDPVPGASFYRLWVKPGGSRYIAASERIPASITQVEHPIPVHLQNWVRTRYVVTACNASGCAGSRALDPRSLMLDTIGYLKASNTDAGDNFGHSVVLSADGHTLAVSAPSEASNATLVDGDQSDNSLENAGAVYVFRRRGNSWHQEAYIKTPDNYPNQFFGSGEFAGYNSLAISPDGSRLMVGTPLAAAFTDDRGYLPQAGAVYAYIRTPFNTWLYTNTLRAPLPLAFDKFGHSVDMSDDARTLKVNSYDPYEEFSPKMRTHIFHRPFEAWLFDVTVIVDPDAFCQSTRLSGDGTTLVSLCNDEGVFALRPRIVTTKRVGDEWRKVAELPVTFFRHLDEPIVLNSDASLMALTEPGALNSVGVYRWNGANWVREAGLPQPRVNALTSGWGHTLAIGNDGRLLAIADPVALDGGAGVSPTVLPGTESRGAVYLYQRSDSAAWSLRNVVKSANPGSGDFFGISVALSASGRTLAVGAFVEDGGSTGIDGDRNDESAENAGALYLY